MDLKANSTLTRADAPESSTERELSRLRLNENVSQAPEFLIESEPGGISLNLGELWRYRELLYFLTLRDIKVRYKQTLLGITWVLIQPLLTMLIFTLVFNRFVRVNTGPMPYPLFALSGLMLWLFFSNAVTNSTASLVLNSHLITKVYFPRMFIPAATVGTGLVDSAVSLTLLIAVAIYYGNVWTWS